MTTYFRNEDGTLYGNGYHSIPVGNSVYLRIIAEAVSGESVIVDQDSPARSKLRGILYDGVMCSATAEDQHGLSDVESFVMTGNSVNFHFDNGNSLVLTQDNWASFRLEWITFRQSFFPLP